MLLYYVGILSEIYCIGLIFQFSNFICWMFGSSYSHYVLKNVLILLFVNKHNFCIVYVDVRFTGERSQKLDFYVLIIELLELKFI